MLTHAPGPALRPSRPVLGPTARMGPTATSPAHMPRPAEHLGPRPAPHVTFTCPRLPPSLRPTRNILPPAPHCHCHLTHSLHGPARARPIRPWTLPPRKSRTTSLEPRPRTRPDPSGRPVARAGRSSLLLAQQGKCTQCASGKRPGSNPAPPGTERCAMPSAAGARRKAQRALRLAHSLSAPRAQPSHTCTPLPRHRRRHAGDARPRPHRPPHAHPLPHAARSAGRG